MKILLINPPRLFENIPVIREDRCETTDRYSIIPPYSLIWIASILRMKKQNVELIDANALNLSYSQLKEKLNLLEYDVLIFRFAPATFEWDMSTAQISKEVKRKAKTVGICLTLWPLNKLVMENALSLDYYVSTDWDTIIPELIESLEQDLSPESVNGITYRKNEKIISNPSVETVSNYNSLPIPAYDLLPDFKLYKPNVPVNGNYSVIYSSKGCPYNCIYCTVAQTPLKLKSSEKVIDELRILSSRYNVKLVSFFDESFTINRKRTIDISNKIKEDKLDLKWYCNTRVNLVDKELLEIMYDGGCRGIAYGIESGSQIILNNVKKDITVEQAKKAIKLTKESGIKVLTSFIFGLPGENWKTVQETINFVKQTLPHSAQFNIAVPYPGTKLYSFAIEKGLLSDMDWKKLYQHKVLMGTEHLTPQDLEKARKMAYRMLYFNPRWIINNIKWVLRDPLEIKMGIRYYFKTIKNYMIYQMEHAH